jgi:hypothetical protein
MGGELGYTRGVKAREVSMLLNRKNLSKMTPAQRAKYHKILANVRAYTRDRREYEKKLKSGEIKKTVTLQQYRDVLKGKSRSVADVHSEGAQAAQELRATGEMGDVVEKLERLLRELKGIEQQKAKVISMIRRLA